MIRINTEEESGVREARGGFERLRQTLAEGLQRLTSSLGGRTAVGTVAVAAAVGTSGCSTTNVYLSRNDSGIMQDADVSGDTENSQDAEIEDSGRPDANLDADQELDVETADMEGDTETCVADLAPRTCETEEPVAEGILSATQSISSEDLAIELVFAGVEEHNGQLALVFDVVDECGNVLQRRMISDEETMILTINGVAYTVSADGIYDGTNPWGHLTVRVNCSLTEEQCEVAAGVINRGEELLFDGFRLRLDDIENGEDTNRAILSVLDRDGTVIDRLIITENSSEIRAYGGVGYTILVGDVAPGYGFGANWAYLTVLRNCVGE